MDDSVFGWSRGRPNAARRFDLVALFRCRHLAWGIAAFPVATALAARRELERLLHAAAGDGRPRLALVATVSSCHGIIDLFEAG
jgi:hypothetical protein